MYNMDGTTTFGAVVAYYEDYLRETKRAGKTPVSFLNFIVGRY